MASASSTEGEKKMCLERISSSGSAWQAAQEAGLAEAAAACFAPRQRKHARCRSPGAREPGQEEQETPGRVPAPERTGPEKGRFCGGSPTPLPPGKFFSVFMVSSKTRLIDQC